MFKKLSYFLVAMAFAPIALGWVTYPVHASVESGAPAPDFEAVDIISGENFKLSEQTGKTVVLEWTNHDCPFVVKHYDTGNMQALQEKAANDGVLWVTVVSSAPGKQGHMDADAAKALIAEKGVKSAVRIHDESGDIGRLYGAKTTPHMYIVNAEGFLVYQGAIDDNSSPDPKTVEGAKNYVTAALDEIAAGNPVSEATTVPYGCSVKY